MKNLVIPLRKIQIKPIVPSTCSAGEPQLASTLWCERKEHWEDLATLVRGESFVDEYARRVEHAQRREEAEVALCVCETSTS